MFFAGRVHRFFLFSVPDSVYFRRPDPDLYSQLCLKVSFYATCSAHGPTRVPTHESKCKKFRERVNIFSKCNVIIFSFEICAYNLGEFI